jgi:hypothetical protein
METCYDISWITNHNCGYRGSHDDDDDHMIEACCGNNIGRGEEELLR